MNQPPPQHQSPQQHPQNAQQPHIPPHIVVLADSSLALAAEWDQLVAEYLFPMLRALTQAPGGGTAKEPVKIRIAVVTYAASSVRPSPLVTKQFFTEPQILRDLQLEPYKLGIGQHPAAAHGLAALEGFVAAIELLDLIRECIPLKDYFPLHIFHLAAAHKDDAQAPRWNDATTLDGVAWDHLPTELRKRNIHLSTICVGKLAEFAELYKQATPESDATHPWFPTRPAHQVLISGLSAHPTHPAQLTHPTQPTQPAHPNQQPNQPNQPAQTIQSAYPAQATQLPQQNHPPAHLPTQPPLPNQPTQPQTPAVPATGAPQAAGAPAPTGTSTPTHAKRTHELAQTERPQADVKRAKPSPEKSSPMVAPAVPPGPASAPSNAPTNALPSTTGQPSAPPAPGPSATTAPPTTTTTPAPGPSSAPPPAPTGPTKHSAALPALPAGLSPQQFGRYRHLLEAKLHSIKAKLDALGRGEAEAGEGEVEGLKKQFEQTGRQLVAFSEFMKVHVARAGGVGVGGVGGAGGTGGEQQAQGETPSGQTAPALTSSPALSNHPPPPQPPQQQDAPKPVTAQTQQQPKPTASPAQFPMPPPTQALNQSQNQNLNPNPNTLGHQRQRSLQDSQRGVGDGHNGGNNGAAGGGVPGNPSPSLMNRMPSGPPNPNTHQQGPESQGGRRGWQGIFSWSGLDPNTQERKEVQTMVSAVFPDEARVNQARPETWPTNLTLHPTTDRAVSQLELRAWLARFTPGLCTFQSVPQDARQNEVNFRSLISLLLAKNIYATASWSAPGGAHVTPNMLIFPTNTNILCGAVFPLTGIPELPKPTPQPPVPAGLPNLPNFTNQMRQQFARMTPEQRQNFMLVARQRQLLSQQQGQQQGQGFAPPNMMNMQGAGIPLMGGMAAMAGKPGGGFPGAAGMAGVQPGLANMMQRFGLPPGTSTEQMQAFLQSNFGGGNSNQLP